MPTEKIQPFPSSVLSPSSSSSSSLDSSNSDTNYNCKNESDNYYCHPIELKEVGKEKQRPEEMKGILDGDRNPSRKEMRKMNENNQVHVQSTQRILKIPYSSLVFIILHIVLNQVGFSQGGSCWLTMNRNGLCSALVKTGATKEECCSSSNESFSNSLSVSWSEGELSPSSVFYMHVQGGVPCSRCRETCDGVKCPENQKCVIRKGVPKCVCSPNCTAFRLQNGLTHHKGPVCGSDGRTYKSTCRLLKRSCRRKVNITIAYYGACKTSCSKLNCPAKKRCLLDQNMIPHCVNCSERKCLSSSQLADRLNSYRSSSSPNQRQGNHSSSSSSISSNSNLHGSMISSLNSSPIVKSVCGADGLTYASMCDLRQAACHRGKAIPVAYKGPCKKRATCHTVRCSEGQTCLVELITGKPRCVTCAQRKWCRKSNRGSVIGPICATNGKTYGNWCEMSQDSCSTGTALDTKHFGKCKKEII